MPFDYGLFTIIDDQSESQHAFVVVGCTIIIIIITLAKQQSLSSHEHTEAPHSLAIQKIV